MRDTDSDGFLDEWNLDLDGDGQAEDSWRATAVTPEDAEWSWGVLNSMVEGEIARSVPDLFTLHERLEQALSIAAPTTPDNPALAKLSAQMEIASASPELARELLASDESLRFFLDVRKDVLIHLLKSAHSDAEIWTEFAEARGRGDYPTMARVLEREFQLTAPLADLGAFREEMLRKLAPKRVAWAQDWVPPNIGWESEKVCYRVYWGQFDFFGKKGDTLILPTIGPVSYHEETEWGIDALLVGKGPGCGGVTLYVNGEAFPVRAPEGKGDIEFTKRLVSESPEKIVIEQVAKGVGPKDSPYTVRFLCSALAGRADSPIEVAVTGGQTEDRLELGIGLSKLPQETLRLDSALGAFSVRGFQTPLIGWIEMGVAFPAERFQRMGGSELENQVVLRIEKDKPTTYHLECNWPRGNRFDCCPTGEDFFEGIRGLAASLR
ncbi:MAG: DUF4861 family protein [Candidatus Omnitrophica bacterium]|nr:DUF4861 family protein [Candidatus Omnitrophota bacterium]